MFYLIKQETENEARECIRGACRHMNTKTHKPFGQGIQMVQVLLLLLVVPDRYKDTIIWAVTAWQDDSIFHGYELSCMS